MGELKILEGLSAFLIILPLLRPFFSKLKNLEGLFFLFPLGFGIILAIFPAYGFRPECIPLLFYTFFLTVIHIPSILTILRQAPLDVIPEKGSVFAIITVILLIPITGIAFLFAPLQEIGLVSHGANIRKVQNPTGKTEFMLRIYGSGDDPVQAGARRPLMLLVPPMAGSVFITDRVCQELQERGFAVISYSRQDFDAPWLGEDGRKSGGAITHLHRLFRIHTRGFKSVPVNTAGRALEEERIQDITFLLSYIQQEYRRDEVFSGIDTRAIFIAGYGIGGGALIQLTASPGFNRANPGVKGIIAVESPVFSAFVGEAPPLPPAADDDDESRFPLWTNVTRSVSSWFSRWKPLKISGVGTVPRPEVPALYMVSDKVRDPRRRDGRYAALFQTLHNTGKPALLAAIPGAGPLDYSDVPEKFPLYRVLFPGTGQSVWRTRNYIEKTATLMTNFAALFYDQPLDGSFVPLRREKLEQDLYLEAGGAWNFRDSQAILGL
jgi:hypothetical protein